MGMSTAELVSKIFEFTSWPGKLIFLVLSIVSVVYWFCPPNLKIRMEMFWVELCSKLSRECNFFVMEVSQPILFKRLNAYFTRQFVMKSTSHKVGLVEADDDSFLLTLAIRPGENLMVYENIDGMKIGWSLINDEDDKRIIKLTLRGDDKLKLFNHLEKVVYDMAESAEFITSDELASLVDRPPESEPRSRLSLVSRLWRQWDPFSL
ncbi:hypothetical protein Dimus_028819 [Dionaea muscipula]